MREVWIYAQGILALLGLLSGIFCDNIVIVSASGFLLLSANMDLIERKIK